MSLLPPTAHGRLQVTPERFRTAAWAGLILLTLIVFTGAAVRLTNSGLGCATWPRCDAHHLTPPDQTHALVEFSNRALSGLVGLVTGLIMIAAFLRRPFRRDLAILATCLPLGVVAQAVLGGFTVREKLAPGFVMSHFGLSMVILIAALWLVWREHYPTGARPRAASRLLVWVVRLSVVLGGLTIFAGTAATAAGPHSGGLVDQHVKRLHFKGADTLVWTIHQHATIAILFGIVTIVAWLLKRREFGTLDPTEPITVLGILIAAQGLVGAVQYEMKLPAEMVWVHVCLASVTWVVALWAWADIGAPSARRSRPDAPDPEPGLRERSEPLEVARF
jgi:cytochrome c oxidase assembly protein subunit 15